MTKTRDLSDFLIEVADNVLPLGKPHIVPDVLYPAVSGKTLSGGVTVSFMSRINLYLWNNNQRWNRTDKYYYTDIKGSKPIKDPESAGILDHKA